VGKKPNGKSQMKLIRILILLLVTAGHGRAQSFSDIFYFSDDAVGAGPVLHLVQGTNGVLYGETFNGHGNSYGTVFAINTNGTGFTNIFSFNYNDGAFPKGGLIISGTNLYGTTYEGGNNGDGTVFALSTDGTVFTNLYNFSGNDGSSPQADLVLSSNILYGSTYGGGTNSNGTLFAIRTDGTGFTNLYIFSGKDGASPNGGMVLSGNKLYGTTYGGGTNLDGSVFSINTDGTGFTNLFSFANYNGYSPMGTLILSGHTLYGTTLMGGTKGYGEIFAINTDGSGFTNLFSFTNGIDGVNPEAGLVLSGHTLYGTADAGGAKNFGDVFSINTSGTGFTTLYSFTNGLDGASPASGVLLSGNTLYGTASGGGTNGVGTIYRLGLPPLPTMTIGISGTNLIINWPTNAASYTLMSGTNLNSSAGWNAVSARPVIINGHNTVTNPIAGKQMFFYLSQ
jgi:uncharacterized repeat protein (TIGR03803 family)